MKISIALSMLWIAIDNLPLTSPVLSLFLSTKNEYKVAGSIQSEGKACTVFVHEVTKNAILTPPE